MPFGSNNTYSIPVDIAMYGERGENRDKVTKILSRYGLRLTGGATGAGSGASSSSQGAGFAAGLRGVTGMYRDISNINEVRLFSLSVLCGFANIYDLADL